MRSRAADLLRTFLTRVTLLSVILIIAAGLASAQRPPAAGPPPVNSPKLETSERDARQNALRGAEIDAATREKRDEERLEAGILQVKQDFTQLQVVRNQIAHNLVARLPLDYSVISNQTKDINKAASRLKIYMMARPPDEKEKEQKNSAELHSDEVTSALVRLCKLIDSFVENPALNHAVDAEHLDKVKEDKARADKDLLTIIELSENLQKSAESLMKPPK